MQYTQPIRNKTEKTKNNHSKFMTREIANLPQLEESLSSQIETHLVEKFESISDHVIYVVLRYIKRYKLQFIETYIPTSPDNNIKRFYGDKQKGLILFLLLET